MSSEEIFKDLLDRDNTLQKSDAILKQNQSRIESKLNWIISILKDKKVKERERPY
jgi:hypothetical protein